MPIPVQLLYTNSVAASNEMISLQAVRHSTSGIRFFFRSELRFIVINGFSSKRDNVIIEQQSIFCGSLSIIFSIPGNQFKRTRITLATGFFEKNSAIAYDVSFFRAAEVRLICISIFQRCIYPMTSRQAIASAVEFGC